MDFSSAAHELYGVAPDDFIETRKRLTREARDGGDAALAKRIGALRRPTVPAWAVNLLSRSAGEELGLLLDVGAEMRSAWSSGGSIGGLEQRRGELVGLLVRRAGELAADAGHPLREQAVREVEDTLQAATVDGDAANDVREGRLDRPRSHTGFVPAGFPTAPSPAPPASDPRNARSLRNGKSPRSGRSAPPSRNGRRRPRRSARRRRGRGARPSRSGTGRPRSGRGRRGNGPRACSRSGRSACRPPGRRWTRRRRRSAASGTSWSARGPAGTPPSGASNGPSRRATGPPRTSGASAGRPPAPGVRADRGPAGAGK
ncbi:hypothetical protein GEV43_36380 [Actinomadura sp. J1-007]|uniref:hypothetical protein n=1 Tax=Actinomadura sp. J1-007 TaxID=2661913 RepID=UPI0013238335|nr:hypothetical protein [Actinomadura sp. J1-007]MWK38967.1 hypothetical protein [Actinomadura sp. J1-007]